jgi:hypothetical protein
MRVRRAATIGGVWLTVLGALASGGHAQAAANDSTYESAALRALVARAAEHNRVVPGALRGYRAALESEIAVLLRNANGTEGAVTVEQVQSAAQWSRTGEYEQHVVGYRSQSLGLTISLVNSFRRAWTVPLLYGNRLSLFFGPDTSRRSRASRRGRALYAVHPLATDRDRVYRFRGGDTVVTLGIGDRKLPIVRIEVEPRVQRLSDETLVFRGEMDLDATREQIVRMRGQFLTVDRHPPGLRERVMGLEFQAIAFVELVNAEIAGAFWLPSYQRIEGQVSVPALGDARSVLRMVTRFRDYDVDGAPTLALARTALDSTQIAAQIAADTTAPRDTLVVRPHHLTFASRDSLERWDAWREPLGTATGAVHADDFDDVAPDAWRTTGPPRFELRVPQFSDLFRFDRVQGAFTGYGARARFRDAAPGLTVQAAAGWAWSEQTVRGRGEIEWLHRRWQIGARAGRSLDLTNDVRSVFDSGGTFAALISSIDDYDYVDRRSALGSVAYRLGKARLGVVRLSAGIASDRPAAPTIARGVLKGDSAFRFNRGIDAGDYRLVSLTWQIHPDVSGEMMRPGIGLLAKYERGDGDLDWQRADLRVMGRRNWKQITYAARVDAGALWSDRPPPQQLFELGGREVLPSYAYKEFAGDRAIVARGLAMYRLGMLRAPLRLTRRLFLPAPSPALAAGIQGGWTDATSTATLRSMERLGTAALGIDGVPVTGARFPISRITNGARTTVDLGVRFFGGSIFVGTARPIDHAAKWKMVVSFGQEL